MDTTWKEVGNEGEKTTWKPEVGEELIGRFTGITTGVGANKSIVYEFTLDSGEVCSVWDTFVLQSKLKEVHEGDMVKIVYNGIKVSKKGKNYHDYSVFIKPFAN